MDNNVSNVSRKRTRGGKNTRNPRLHPTNRMRLTPNYLGRRALLQWMPTLARPPVDRDVLREAATRNTTNNAVVPGSARTHHNRTTLLHQAGHNVNNPVHTQNSPKIRHNNPHPTLDRIPRRWNSTRPVTQATRLTKPNILKRRPRLSCNCNFRHLRTSGRPPRSKLSPRLSASDAPGAVESSSHKTNRTWIK